MEETYPHLDYDAKGGRFGLTRGNLGRGSEFRRCGSSAFFLQE